MKRRKHQKHTITYMSWSKKLSTEILFEHSATPTQEDKERYPTLVSDDEDEKEDAAAAAAGGAGKDDEVVEEVKNPSDTLQFKMDGFTKHKKGSRIYSDSKTTKDVTW